MRRRDTRGVAIPTVLFVLIILFPLVSALFLRSHVALRWLAKHQDLQQATVLAEEGETVAVESLRSGSPSAEGERRVPLGGMFYRTQSLGAGPAGQSLFLVAGEGLCFGEERLVVSLVEVSATSGVTLVLPHDRSWVAADAGGGGVVSPTDLVTPHQQRVDTYLQLLSQESSMDPAVFLSRMDAQVKMLDCPDMASAWPQIAAGLASAKAPPVPGL